VATDQKDQTERTPEAIVATADARDPSLDAIVTSKPVHVVDPLQVQQVRNAMRDRKRRTKAKGYKARTLPVKSDFADMPPGTIIEFDMRKAKALQLREQADKLVARSEQDI
jgi:hypothetical protein